MELLDKIKDLWLKALRNNDEDTRIRYFHKLKLNSEYANEIDQLLKEYFSQYSKDYFHKHLILVERCFDYTENKRGTLALYITEIFLELIKEQNYLHAANKSTDEQKQSSMTHEEYLDEKIVLRAFDISTAHHINLFLCFSNIYKFVNYKYLLKETTIERLENFCFSEKALLLGELELQEICNIKELIIPLLIQNQYDSVDLYIKNNIAILENVLELLDELCNFNLHLKNLLKLYELVPKKVIDKFKAKVFANYAQKALKKANKYNLIEKYKNIKLQILLSQVRFLISSKYDKYRKNEMSEEAWMELVLDVVQNEEALRIQLLNELINYRKDIQSASIFINLFGSDIVSKLSINAQRLYDEANKNLNFEKVIPVNNKDTYYNPQIEKIIFVDNLEKFHELLIEFETHKLDYANVVGLDCEWRPCFGFDQDDTRPEQLGVSTLQISNRKTCYIIDMTYFMKSVSNDLIQRFASSILCSNDIIKFGTTLIYL